MPKKKSDIILSTEIQATLEKLYAAKQELERKVQTLYRVNDFMASVTDLKKLLTLIMEESKDIVEAEASSLLLYDAKTDELYFDVAKGGKEEEIKQIRLRMGEGIAGTVAKTRKELVVNDVKKDKRFAQRVDKATKFETRNILAVPMIRKDRLIGVVEAINKKNQGQFTDKDTAILRVLADLAAIAIENAQLYAAKVHAERLAAMGEAVAGLAHYIKNVLSGVKGGMELVETAIKNHNQQLLEESWTILKNSNMKIAKLIADMLNYSKDRKPEYKLCSLNKIIEDTLMTTQKKAKERNVILQTQLDPNMPAQVCVDPTGINDILLNLIFNAVDAIDHGHGKITISSKYDTTTDQIQLSVTDNGTGIPPHIVSRIFDPFFSTKGSGGTGLGLAVTQKIVNEHNGTISVKSVLNKGTTFTITIPAKRT
ncbi:MAG: ATP-binding protein [bacterium]|nr:ATP-binding protein [bacterium]